MDAKIQKKKFGVTMAPTPCTEVWRRSMAFDHNSKGIVTFSYIAINRYLGTRTHINLYNGDTGPGYNAKLSTHPIKNWGVNPALAEEDLAKTLRLGKDNAYHRCRIVDCPAVVIADPPEGWTEPPILEPPILEVPSDDSGDVESQEPPAPPV